MVLFECERKKMKKDQCRRPLYLFRENLSKKIQSCTNKISVYPKQETQLYRKNFVFKMPDTFALKFIDKSENLKKSIHQKAKLSR